MNAGVKALSEQARKLTERFTLGMTPALSRSSSSMRSSGVKVTALTLLLRPHAPDRGRAALAARLRELLRRARDVGAHLHIDAHADLDEIVPAVLGPAFGFAGQKCPAASRLRAPA
jgi:RHH-type proline utilization regulon transcriptional repressor/proline dehydrogenase/delta 1-pyrroline-5-carboxylate dehydrogenase